MKKTITPDAGKTITEIRVYAYAASSFVGWFDAVTIVCQHHVEWLSATGKLVSHEAFSDAGDKDIFINASDKLYQTTRESY